MNRHRIGNVCAGLLAALLVLLGVVGLAVLP